VRKQRPVACCCPWAGKRKEGSGPVAGSRPAGRGLGLKGRRGGLRVWKGFVFFKAFYFKPFSNFSNFKNFQTLFFKFSNYFKVF
jgi:hypothetical protein